MTSNGPVHHDWNAVICALRDGGVAPELTESSLPARLGVAAMRPPERPRVSQVLRRYFDGDGHPMVGRRRRREARCFRHLIESQMTANGVVARLGLTCPELGVLRLYVHPEAAQLLIESDDGAAQVLPTVVDADDPGRIGKDKTVRVVTVRALVAAVNSLLLTHRAAYRMVPLLPTDGWELYLGLTLTQAQMLDELGIFEQPLADLVPFIQWHYDMADELDSILAGSSVQVA